MSSASARRSMQGSPRSDLSPSRASLALPLDDWDVVAREVVFAQELANFHFDQFERFGVVHHVTFVQEDDDVRYTNLTRQEDVFARLRHRAVSSGDHEDGAVHLGGTGDHVLDVVRWPGQSTGVVTVGRFVFNVRGVDGDAACLFFRRRVNLVGRPSPRPNLRDNTVVIAAVNVVLP